MEKEFLDEVEDNAAVRIWAEIAQQEKGDSFAEGVIQNNLQEMKEIWDRWDDEIKQLFYCNYDLVPTVEEYTALLRCPKIHANKVYSRSANTLTFKGDSKCIPWRILKDLILAHLDVKKRVDVFALSIYGLVIFPKALGHVDEAVSDLFDRLDKRVTPVPAILTETFRSLNACRRAGKGKFARCAQLLLA
ncbi:disease resistance protein [Gossypium australe]|uniref:Disease resistance protein n=1 Tax=Gossypium australe TaxID=47621 RepID=A0A5B6VK41_9ROSI|nr:disease resistance protein [Gossypium australe]